MRGPVSPGHPATGAYWLAKAKLDDDEPGEERHDTDHRDRPEKQSPEEQRSSFGWALAMRSARLVAQAASRGLWRWAVDAVVLVADWPGLAMFPGVSSAPFGAQGAPSDLRGTSGGSWLLPWGF